MSADLLRRAAETLRQHAQAATPGPWACDSDGEVFSNASDEQPEVGWFAIKKAGNGPYVVLMHPPVALALADLLDAVAENMEHDFTCTRTADEFSPPVAAVARAILREPQS